jgi:uncharacterized protein (TIGR00725 family)
MNTERRCVVSVVGGANCTQEQYAKAEEVGRLLAEEGAILVCGGRSGVMEAACRGAHEAGGVTLGILPGFSRADGNDYLTIAIPTGLGHARNALVVQAGHVVIAIGGGYGTLSEVGIALKTGRKVIGLNSWQATDSEGRPAKIIQVNSPKEAVGLAISFASKEGLVG